MKGVNMKAPALSEIYTKKIMQQAHLKKLNQIRSERRSYIGFNHNQISSIQQFRDSKSKSFAQKFNQQSSQINRQNLKFLARLQKTKPYFRYTSHDNRQNLNKSQENNIHVTIPFVKKQIEETQKQNLRLSNRVNSISSSLNQKNLMKDFVKSQRIKSRIARYTIAQDNKVTLKSEKYVGNLSSSKISHSSQKNVLKPKIKSTVGNYYKKQDIMKYKIETSTKSLMRLKNKLNFTTDENNDQNKDTFFTTQPLKNHIKHGEKRIISRK